MWVYLLPHSEDAEALQTSTRMEEQVEERPAIPQEEAVQTQAAMDFRNTLSAIFRPRIQEAVV
jgi:hypothetical protein